MAQININTGGLIHARVGNDYFVLTDIELDHINRELAVLEGKIPREALIELAITKCEDSFSGTIRIDLLNLYCFGKGESVESLFSNLVLKIVIEINQYTRNYKRLRALFRKQVHNF